MSPPVGTAEWPGVESVLSADGTITHGILPSTFFLTIDIQDKMPKETGTFAFRFGSTRIEFPDCALASIEENQGGGPKVWILKIVDRRWKWQFENISGSYNQIKPNNKIDGDTEKTPRELAKILLKAMGETGFDVSKIPNDSRPRVYWDHANAASELQNLCNSLGCRVMLSLKNKVKIEQLGEGKDLPKLKEDRETEHTLIDPSPRPDHLKVLCSPTRYQFRFRCEAVGQEEFLPKGQGSLADRARKNGSIKKINDLTYMPSDTWRKSIPPHFGNLEPVDKTERELKLFKKRLALAQESVFRWYRIRWEASQIEKDHFGREEGSLQIPDYPEDVKHLWQILPLYPQLLEHYDDKPFTGQQNIERFREIVVDGKYFDGDFRLGSTRSGTAFQGDFSMDLQKGIVKFSEPVWRYADTDKNGVLMTDDVDFNGNRMNELGVGIPPDDVETEQTVPAEIYVTVSFSIKDLKTRVPQRYFKEKRVSGRTNDTGPKLLRHNELFLTKIGHYQLGSPNQLDRIDDNGTELDKFVDAHLDDAMREYEIRPKESRSYAGIHKIELDGKIQQVSWQVGGGNIARTFASSNADHDFTVPSHAEQQEIDHTRESDSLKPGKDTVENVLERREIDPNRPPTK